MTLLSQPESENAGGEKLEIKLKTVNFEDLRLNIANLPQKSTDFTVYKGKSA